MGWVDFDADYPEIEECDAGIRETYDEHRAVLIRHLRENNICFAGYDHQRREGCTPLFSNGAKMTTSFRCWGAIMFEAWKDRFDDPNDKLGYCRFAWLMPESMKATYPTEKENP